MIGIMKEMKKKKSGISEDVIFIFENILNRHKDEQGRLNLIILLNLVQISQYGTKQLMT